MPLTRQPRSASFVIPAQAGTQASWSMRESPMWKQFSQRGFFAATASASLTGHLPSGLLKKPFLSSLRAEMTRHKAGHRSAAISKSLLLCQLRSPRPAREARSRLAMTGVEGLSTGPFAGVTRRPRVDKKRLVGRARRRTRPTRINISSGGNGSLSRNLARTLDAPGQSRSPTAQRSQLRSDLPGAA